MKQPVALVTGANKGIGFEVARGMAKSGFVVVLGARNPTSGREAVKTLTREGLDVRFVELDVTRMETVSAAAARVEADFGKLDVLVNNAGIADRLDGPPSRASVDAVHRVLRTNFLGAVAVTQAVLPAIEEVRSRPDCECLERTRIDREPWRPHLEVCSRQGVGVLRVESGDEHVHRPIGLRTEGSAHRGEFGQSRLHGDGPECA